MQLLKCRLDRRGFRWLWLAFDPGAWWLGVAVKRTPSSGGVFIGWLVVVAPVPCLTLTLRFDVVSPDWKDC
jgi:apolipoprotein N-acyltransferase